MTQWKCGTAQNNVAKQRQQAQVRWAAGVRTPVRLQPGEVVDRDQAAVSVLQNARMNGSQADSSIACERSTSIHRAPRSQAVLGAGHRELGAVVQHALPNTDHVAARGV